MDKRKVRDPLRVFFVSVPFGFCVAKFSVLKVAAALSGNECTHYRQADYILHSWWCTGFGLVFS